MKAIIMAGGEGSRLRPLTCDLPKPMVPVMDRPVMTYSIELLKKYGITDIGVTLQYLPESVKDHFYNGTEYGVSLKYFIEDSPLGTAGSVKNAGNFLDQTFIVVSGDALTDINIQDAVDFHRRNKSMATLVLKQVEVPLEYGVVVTDELGSIKRFLEKPNWGEVFSDTVNTGIYILEPQVLDYFDAGVKFDFSQQLFPMLLKDNQPMFGYVTNEYWCDIGNSQTYLSAHYDMLGGRINFPIPGHQFKEGVWVGEGTQIDKDAIIEGPCYIGDYTRVSKDATIGAYSVIGAHCNIEAEASIKKSILWNHVTMGRGTEVRGATLCNKVELKDKSSIYEGVVVGDGCQLNSGTVVKPEVKIWPGKTIDEGTIVQSNIIWGTKTSKTLFGKDGIYGTINMDLSPLSMTRMGAALGAYLKPEKRVAVSTDHGQGNNMLKYALISGLLSTGLEIFDLGQLTTPVMRFAVKHLGLDGGVHIFSMGGNPNEGRLHFIDPHGCNLSPSVERKIENLYTRDDFQRQVPDKIKRVHTMQDIPIFYIRSLVDAVDVQAIRKRSPRVLISSKGRLGSYILNQVLNEAGCQIQKTIGDPMEAIAKADFDIACIMEPNSEDYQIFNERGELIHPDKQRAIVSLIYLKEKHGGQMVVPYNATGIMEQLASSYDCSVIRTKSSKYSMMEEVFKRDQEDQSSGTKLFPLYFDGTAALTKLIELMSRENTTLSQISDDIPEFHMRQKDIKCPWTAKGRVMRSLIEEESKGDNKVELYEGIKISHDNGWALILPDSDDPVCRVYSEGYTEEYAEELADFYEKRINQIKSN